MWPLILLTAMEVLQAQVFVEATPAKGEGALAMLRRFLLPTDSAYVQKFYELNADRLGPNASLQAGKAYRLPIIVFEYDRVGIRTSLGIDDRELAARIDDYNRAALEAGLRSAPYQQDERLWVPFFEVLSYQDNSPPVFAPPVLSAPQQLEGKVRADTRSLYGSKNEAQSIGNSLAGHYFYLISGHGGPDPGAVGLREGVKLYEDEYAYDITLRLARALEAHGATVFMIIRDPDDGIREEGILRGDRDERFIDGSKISNKTMLRLQKQVSLVNELYRRHGKSAKSQWAVHIHVDSRSDSKRIDLFFYYQRTSEAGRKLALTLQRVFRKKYDTHQPGRG
ncbi:MAG: N-acetylmuramoyl-L-alanine amidase, partial [candidate division KSB1 bacterium]|nr:N-acetylmuramoyl-L-alanine amidase [candidate division KSB1 bacterium]